MRLRGLLDRPVPWTDRTLQALWKETAQAPEAQYALLHYLNSYAPARKDDRLRRLRGELETRLLSMEVKP
jgi:hypothetical protein